VTIQTVRPDGMTQSFAMSDQGTWLESAETIPEPHDVARLRIGDEAFQVAFEEYAPATTDRDNNFRAAARHVMADASVSVPVIAGLILALAFGWLWIDPLAGIIGACVIASWSRALIRDTGAILLDMNPDRGMAENLRQAIENDSEQIADLHLWRFGPGHLGAIVSVSTREPRGLDHYRARLARFPLLSHLTIEVQGH
jgi:cation diffusion facilitator family transporter